MVKLIGKMNGFLLNILPIINLLILLWS